MVEKSLSNNPESESLTTEGAEKCRSILVVEDNVDIRETVVDVLKTEGYRAYGVTNGREALRALASAPKPTLVLLDMMMPWMNGWEFLEAQKKDARFANLPIVVMTALNAEKALVKGNTLVNAQGYIRKPIELDTLMEIVRVYCGSATDDVVPELELDDDMATA